MSTVTASETTDISLDQSVVVTHHSSRNPGMPLTEAMFDGHMVNLSAAQRRAATLVTRRSIKKQWQAAWLVNALQCVDLTTLAGDGTRPIGKRVWALACRGAHVSLPE